MYDVNRWHCVDGMLWNITEQQIDSRKYLFSFWLGNFQNAIEAVLYQKCNFVHLKICLQWCLVNDFKKYTVFFPAVFPL